jgi:hypothetical protein
LAEDKKSMSVVNASVAAINHFCSRNRFDSHLKSPYFALVLRGIKNEIHKSPIPKIPFSVDHIVLFLGLAHATDDFRMWRGVFAHVVCFQQLMRADKAYSLKGANVVSKPGVLKLINVKAKNHHFEYPTPLSFVIDESNPCCVGQFMVEYMRRFLITFGKVTHFFGCKVVRQRGGLFVPHQIIAVSKRTLINDGKASIKSIGLDLTRFASHSAKHGGALAAAEAGLDVAGLATVGNWSSLDMAVRYIRGSEAYRNSLIDQFCPK